MRHIPIVRLLAFGLLAALLGGAQALAQKKPDNPTSGTLVYVVPVKGEFENALHLILVRALRQAEREGAKAVVLDMDTPGGRVDSAIKIRDALIKTNIKTYTYVNPMAISAGSFIAVATDTIVMGRNGSIGGALPITLNPDGARGADEKFISVFAAEMRKTAKTKGHPEKIAEGFCNPNLVIPGLKEKGQILTLDFDQATSVGLAAYQSPTLAAMLEREGFKDARVVYFHQTVADSAARFLSNSAVLGVLMLIGLGGIFLELKAPGVSLPGIIGVIAISLYFFGSYLANMSSYLEWLVFVAGVVLLALEIYVIPGFGAAGIAGILLIVGSLFMGLIDFAPDQGWEFSPARLNMLVGPLLTMVVSLLALIPFLYLLSRLFPATSLYRGLVLKPAEAEADSAPVAAPPRELRPVLVGDLGQAVTDLYPGGVARIHERRVDVQTEGEFLGRQEAIVVVRVEGARIFVRQASPRD